MNGFCVLGIGVLVLKGAVCYSKVLADIGNANIMFQYPLESVVMREDCVSFGFQGS